MNYLLDKLVEDLNMYFPTNVSPYDKDLYDPNRALVQAGYAEVRRFVDRFREENS